MADWTRLRDEVRQDYADTDAIVDDADAIHSFVQSWIHDCAANDMTLPGAENFVDST